MRRQTPCAKRTSRPVDSNPSPSQTKTTPPQGAKLEAAVVPGNADHWQWVDEGSSACPGCHKYGWASKEVGGRRWGSEGGAVET